MIGSVRRLLGVLSAASILGGVAILANPLAAQADVLSVTACDSSALSQPFIPWADGDYYKLAPGGDFEGALGGWSLQGGASQASGSESYGVTGSVGSSSLLLPDGANATSPQTCVNAAYPSFRLFTRSDSPGATVTVSVIYGSATIPVGVITPGASWQLSPPLLTGSAIAGAFNGGTANVKLSFSASRGAVQVDDVYVDPYSRGG